MWVGVVYHIKCRASVANLLYIFNMSDSFVIFSGSTDPSRLLIDSSSRATSSCLIIHTGNGSSLHRSGFSQAHLLSNSPLRTRSSFLAFPSTNLLSTILSPTHGFPFAGTHPQMHSFLPNPQYRPSFPMPASLLPISFARQLSPQARHTEAYGRSFSSSSGASSSFSMMSNPVVFRRSSISS